MTPPSDIEHAMSRARHYCAYQERCIKEVMVKLKEWRVKADVAEKVVLQLKNEGYIDEERYARIYTSGHFANKQWGKTRIKYELKNKGIPEEMIFQALDEIDEEDYKGTLIRLLEKKKKEIKASDPYTRKKKLISYAVQKGYEYDVVRECLEGLL